MKRKWMTGIIIVITAALLLTVSAGIAKETAKHKKLKLPQAAVEAIAALSARAAVQEVEREELLDAFDAEVKDSAGEYNVVVTADGKILSTEMEIGQETLPAAVAEAFAREFKGAALKEIEKETILAELQIVPLASPKTTYGAVAVIDGKQTEITVDSAGKVIKMEADDDEDGDDKDADNDTDDDDDNDDENEKDDDADK